MSTRALGALVGAVVLIIAVVAGALALGRGSSKSTSTARPLAGSTGAATTPQAGASPATGATATATAPAGPPPVITPADAKKAVLTYIAANNKANSTFNDAAEQKIETDVAAQADKASYHIYRVMKEQSPAFQAQDVTVLVPRQTTYPAAFAATFHFKPHDGPLDKGQSIYYFTKKTASATWRLSTSGYVPVKMPTLQASRDADGFIPTFDVKAAGMTPAAIRQAFVMLQRATITGQKAASLWVPGKTVTDVVDFNNKERGSAILSFAATAYAPVCVATTPVLCLASTQGHLRGPSKANRYWVFLEKSRQSNYGLPNGHYASYDRMFVDQATILVSAPAHPRLTLADVDETTIKQTAGSYLGR